MSLILNTTITENNGPEIQRFLKKIKVLPNNCWEWQAARSNGRYGSFTNKNRKYQAHRFIYEYFYGNILPNHIIHHRCNNPSCVNPIHLEETTQKRNLLYSNITLAFLNIRKTICIRGHPFNKLNTVITKRNQRRCKICRSVYSKKYRMSKKQLQLLQ